MGSRESFADVWAYERFHALELLSRALPIEIGRRLAPLAGRASARWRRDLYAIVVENQARILGCSAADDRAKRSATEAFVRYARYWAETFRLPALPPADLLRRTEARGLERLDDALRGGRGCILVGAHFGNYDAGVAYLAARGHEIVAVVEDLRPPRLERLFARHRARLGVRSLPRRHGPSLRTQVLIRRVLAGNGIVGLLADRDLSGPGIEVEMFGAKRLVPAGPAALARATGADIVVGHTLSHGRGWRVELTTRLHPSPESDDVQSLTQTVATALQRSIELRPADWHLFERGWESA